MKLAAQFYTNSGNVLKGNLELDTDVDNFLEKWFFHKIKRAIKDPETFPIIEFGNVLVKSKEVVGFSIERKK